MFYKGTHKKKPEKVITLRIPVNKYLDKVSRIGDRRGLSCNARSDIVTAGLETSNADLTAIPCSSTSMWRSYFYEIYLFTILPQVNPTITDPPVMEIT